MEKFTSKLQFTTDALGFGTYLIPPGEETYKAVSLALEVGYRSIDSAKYYESEQDVGRAVKDAGLSGQVQITTKLWNTEQGYEKALTAGRRSRDYLGVESIDLFLVHWPGKSLFVETWMAFEKLKSEGTVKNIGVSNFNPHHLKALEEAGLSTPVINQIEMSPLLTQENVRNYCNEKGIIVEAWGPIVQGKISELSGLQDIADKYSKTRAQVALRWAVEHGCRVLPKSVHKDRMIENIDIFDFSLTPDEVKAIDSLNRNFRNGPDPDKFF